MTHDKVTAAKATVDPLGAAPKSSVVVEHFMHRLNAQEAQRTERQRDLLLKKVVGKLLVATWRPQVSTLPKDFK